MSHPNTAADLAMRAIDGGTDRQYLTTDGREGLATDVSDLLANLRHLCDRYGLDFGRLDELGLRSYQGDQVEYDATADQREWDSPTRTQPKAIGPSTEQTVKEALEGDSNDAEHDALADVADDLGIEWSADA